MYNSDTHTPIPVIIQEQDKNPSKRRLTAQFLLMSGRDNCINIENQQQLAG
jgi:hypothetical protein